MGTRAVTSYDVARRAQVSQSTVSRALRGDPKVLLDTQERIRAIASEMGYVPHIMARSLITRKSSTVAVISGDLRNPTYPTLINTLQDALTVGSYRVLLMSDRTEGRHDDDISALRGGLVDGVIFNSARIDSPLIRNMIDWEIPLVVLSRDVDADTASRVDRVTSDNVGGGREVAKHLISLGHRRIGLIGGPLDHPSVSLRERGFRAALDEAEAPLADELVTRGPIDPTTGFEMGTALLTSANPPSAVFCATDYVAMGLLDAAKRLGLRVPDDIQVVGYNDLELASWSMFDLTTVRQPLESMARAAAELLMKRIDGDDGPAVHRTFDVELVVRGSSGPLRGL